MCFYLFYFKITRDFFSFISQTFLVLVDLPVQEKNVRKNIESSLPREFKVSKYKATDN